jgi:hypothetical protein
VKIYVAAVEALRTKERQDETQFTTKIDGLLSVSPRLELLCFLCFFVFLVQRRKIMVEQLVQERKRGTNEYVEREFRIIYTLVSLDL